MGAPSLLPRQSPPLLLPHQLLLLPRPLPLPLLLLLLQLLPPLQPLVLDTVLLTELVTLPLQLLLLPQLLVLDMVPVTVLLFGRFDNTFISSNEEYQSHKKLKFKHQNSKLIDDMK